MEDPSRCGLKQELLGEGEPVKGAQAVSWIDAQPGVAPSRDRPDVDVGAKGDVVGADPRWPAEMRGRERLDRALRCARSGQSSRPRPSGAAGRGR